MNYLSPSEIALPFAKSVIQKDAFSTARLWIYSLLGGAFISLGGLLALIVAGGMPELAVSNPGLVKLMFGAVFPLGMVLVVIGGAELFTSDCAVVSFGLLNKKISPKRMLRLWTIGYFGNFAGALLVAYLFAYQSGILNTDPWLSFSMKIGELKTSTSFLKVFIKGIGANWLVCMAVWIAYAAKDISGKIMGLWFPIMAFVTLGFEHCIANMFFIPTAIFLGANIGMADFLLSNLLPATLGNMVGGAVFVALAYWYMFSQSKEKEEVEGVKTANTSLKDITKLNKQLN